MHGPDRTDYPNESEFLEIIPASLIRIRHVHAPHFNLSISLKGSAAGTRVSWFGVFEDRAFAEGKRQFRDTANEQNLDRLAREVGKGPQGLG